MKFITKTAILIGILVLLLLCYSAVEKTTVSRSTAFEDATLTYVGLGIHGSGFFGFETRRIEAQGADHSQTALATPDGWIIQERNTNGGLTLFGLITESSEDQRGAPIPDYDRIQQAAYFYSSDGSSTGTVRDGQGSFNMQSPKGDFHYKIIDGRPIFAGRNGG